MDSRETKRTVPYPSVGAGGEQPNSQICTTDSISEAATENNPQDESMEDILRELQRTSDPAYLHTVSMNELYRNVYQSRPPIIDGLLYPGTYLFAGAPKVGKSFLMAQLAYHVSMGLPLWGYPVHKGTVLYLALEDDHCRLQGRLYRMFGMDGTNDLLFAIYAKQLGLGLEEQLKKFVRQHPDTKLIIIDTLQKVREVGGDKYSYANDYEVVGKLKRLADDCGICLLLVHHTRKQQADDKFDMISGTNGLLGAADGAFLLQKEKRTDGSAILDVAGRDQQDQRMYLTKDKERLVWELERQEQRLKELAPAVRNMEQLAAQFSDDPERILPEPGPLESAKSYREKKAKPLLAQIVKVLRSLYRAYVELKRKYERLQGDYGRAREGNERLSDRLQETKLENKALRGAIADFERVKRAFGPEEVERAVEDAKRREAQEREQKKAKRRFRRGAR